MLVMQSWFRGIFDLYFAIRESFSRYKNGQPPIQVEHHNSASNTYIITHKYLVPDSKMNEILFVSKDIGT